MRIIDLSDPAIKRAARDFYRAYAQRSKWAREKLLLDGEASSYDEELKDRFERKQEEEFNKVQPQSDSDKKNVGRKLCLWASQQSFNFRNIVKVWITSGTYQGLADRMEIGWHPDYSDILKNEEVDQYA